MNNCFPKIARLLSKKDFRRVSKSNQHIYGSAVIIDYRFGREKSPRLGITVSRKYGKANLRNRFKRIIREAFRVSTLKLPPHIEINVRPRGTYNDGHFKKTFLEISSLFDNAFKSISSKSSATKSS